jgi:uncharacterized damage-inducible protein DinB
MRRDDPAQSPAAVLGALLEASRQALMDAISTLDEEGFKARPDTSQWSAAEVLAHLLAAERISTQHAQAALSQQRVTIAPVTEDERQEQARLAQRAPVPQILHGLLAQRRDTLRLLEGLSSGQLAMALTHPSESDETVAEVFQQTAEHETEHAAQVRALRTQPAARTS